MPGWWTSPGRTPNASGSPCYLDAGKRIHEDFGDASRVCAPVRLENLTASPPRPTTGTTHARRQPLEETVKKETTR